MLDGRRMQHEIKMNNILIHEDHCPRNPVRNSELKTKKMNKKQIKEYRNSQTPSGLNGHLINLLMQEESLMNLRAVVLNNEPKTKCICKFKINKTELAKFRQYNKKVRQIREKMKSNKKESKHLSFQLRSQRKATKTGTRAVNIQPNSSDLFVTIPTSETGEQRANHMDSIKSEDNNPIKGFQKFRDPISSPEINEEHVLRSSYPPQHVELTKVIVPGEIIATEPPAMEIIDSANIKKEIQSPIKTAETKEASETDESFEEGEVMTSKKTPPPSTASNGNEFQSSERSTDDDSEADDEVDDNKCLICDKLGHNSFYCQMICTNCSAKHHSFKNCPNPPNLHITMQTFMEFTMKQLMTYNVNHKFSFPLNEMTAPVGEETEKETSDSKSSEEENSSDDKAKSKRRRGKVINAQRQLPFSFQMMAPSATFNPLLFPYGAPINWTNK